MTNINNIRNFAIIAHIDHGKSTLSDRMLEITKTVPKRLMKNQALDSMELERERGITIKMAPVRMNYRNHILNLIDTPGHIDFAYEVSRAMSAIEGVILLVDATQGIEAQTMSVLNEAKKQNLVIIPALSKIDSPLARVDDIKTELSMLLDIDDNEIFLTSGKTGVGVEELLDAVIEKIPAPKKTNKDTQALIFDFKYSDHKGIILFLRVVNGQLKKRDNYKFAIAKESFKAMEVGVLKPDEESRDELKAGEIGYLVTGIKKPGIVNVGDTVIEQNSNTKALDGYMSPEPVIWASIYPESQDDLALLKQSLERLKLMDSSLSYEEESSGVIGRGFRCGFLGMLHMEIITERLRREFNLDLVVTLPTAAFEVELKNGKKETIYTPAKFPDDGEIKNIKEEWVRAHIIMPPEFLSPVLQLIRDHEGIVENTETLLDGRTELLVELPLRELMRNFFDKIKNVTSGFASLSYDILGMREGNVTRMDVLIAEEINPAFSKIVSKSRVKEEADFMVSKLDELLPRQQFVLKIQAKAMGKIISSRKKSATRKDVTAKLYGGDVTRKRKLLEKQKKGKKKLLAKGKVHISQDVFLKVLRS